MRCRVGVIYAFGATPLIWIDFLSRSGPIPNLAVRNRRTREIIDPQ